VSPGPLADAGTPDAIASEALLLAAALAALVAVQRLRGRAFRRLPTQGAWAVAGVAVAALVLAFVVPPLIRPIPASVRPRSTAHLRVLSPGAGQVFTGAAGSLADVPVRVVLTGARIVPFTTTRLTPDTGHLHVYVDGVLASMTTGTSLTLHVPPGSHLLRVDFVAADHAPFSPPVEVRVPFSVQT
jgi:hypothetical protein